MESVSKFSFFNELIFCLISLLFPNPQDLLAYKDFQGILCF